MSVIPVLDHDAVLAAVSPTAAIEHVREALLRHHRGEWVMPAKLYLDCPPPDEPSAAADPERERASSRREPDDSCGAQSGEAGRRARAMREGTLGGDFRAMPARGDGLAMLKWITSFPGNPARGLPTVTGVVCLSDATNGEPLMLLDARSVTALRTGAVAAVATRALARPDARTVGIIGCGLHGAWTARCLATAGYGPGICFDPRAEAAQRVAAEFGWTVGSRGDAARCEIVSCITPGATIVLDAGDLRAGQHLNMLGADGSGKAEASVSAVASCSLFCDEYEQASHGGELTGAIRAGMVSRERVTELGAVLAGVAPGRPGPEAVTLFDSTGLAIQDLAIARAALQAYRDGRIEAQTVRL